MRGINKVILIGNATRDAELRFTGSGKAVASLRLATNRTIRGQEETQFHNVVCWEGLAETVSKFVKTGDPLYVEGRLQYRSYQDEEGKERGVAEIVAGDVQFLGRRKEGTTSEPTDVSLDQVGASSAPTHPAGKDDPISPDEIPF